MAALDHEAARALDAGSSFHFPEHIFSIPKVAEGSPDALTGYFLGHSLGLQTSYSRTRVLDLMGSWSDRGIRGHFEGEHPWYPLQEEARDTLALLTGGLPAECVLMNSLSVNAQLLFSTFYRPEDGRQLVLMEGGAFPSDRYGLRTHLRTRGVDPDKSIIEVNARPGEHVLRDEDILAAIEAHGSQIALVYFGGVQFVSGQVLDMQEITRAAHAKGCIVGFDLAHAIGNIPLSLHEWGVDFAVFCGYKYLCGGAGNGGGAFIHEKHVTQPDLPHYGGWWGNDPATRFEMRRNFEPVLTADRFALSNPPSHSAAAALGGLDAFEQASRLNGGTLDRMWERREQLWRFLYDTVSGIQAHMPTVFEIITPAEDGAHGAMLSIFVPGKAEAVEKALEERGFAADARGNSIVRISTVPFWVSAEQVYNFGEALREILAAQA